MEAKKLLNEQAIAESKVINEDAGNGVKRC